MVHGRDQKNNHMTRYLLLWFKNIKYSFPIFNTYYRKITKKNRNGTRLPNLFVYFPYKHKRTKIIS